MLEAARRHLVCLGRIIFAGSLSAVRRYGEALLQARSKRWRHQLKEELWRVLASDALPHRPGRREPHAVNLFEYGQYQRTCIISGKLLMGKS